MRFPICYSFLLVSICGSVNANPYSGSHTGTGFSFDIGEASEGNGTVYSANLVTGLSGATGDYVGSYGSSNGAKTILLFLADLTGTTYLVMLKDAPEVAPGWAQSSWLGFFEKSSYPMIYHEDLGWLHVEQSEKGWAWFYSDELGWIWSRSEYFPALYLDLWKRWSYAVRTSGGSTQLYDYANKEWFPFGQRYQIQVTSEPSPGGFVFGVGTGSYKRWDNVSLTAYPKADYVFSGWSGDAVGDQLQFSTEAIHDLVVRALFSPVPSGNEGAKLVFDAIADMEYLSDSEKRQAVADVLVLGYSDKASLSLVSSKQALPKNFSAEAFGKDSATLTHDYFPGELNSRWTYEDEQGKEWHSDASAVEVIHGVHCLKLEHLMMEGLSARWYAEDAVGNLWVLRETFYDGRENRTPWIFLPVQPQHGWVIDDVGFDGLVSISAMGVRETLSTGDSHENSIEISYHSDAVTVRNYFAPKVGMIRSASLELVKYTP